MYKPEPAWAATAAFLLLACLPSTVRAEKTDVVTLINGDRVTGEVKSLEFANLRYSTDSMGTVNIEWEEIVALTSDQSLQVEVASGTRYFGNLLPASAEGLIAVGRGDNVEELDITHVVRITPIETDESIWQRLEGSISFGFNSGKASSVTTGNLNGNVRYRSRRFLLGFEVNSSVTDQPGAPTTQNRSLGVNYQRFRPNRWYADWFAKSEVNDEQGVEQRYLVGGGLGRYLVQNNNNQLSLLAGLVATHERQIGAEPATTEPEGKFSLVYQHRQSDPANDIYLTTNVYPMLRDLTSYRSDSNLTLRREVINDLFFDLSIYYNYLSNPPVGASKDDYGVVTSIGYSF